MCSDQSHMVSVGFVREDFPAGTHVCQIFGDDGERDDALLQFLLNGLQGGERAACFSDGIDFEAVKDWLRDHAIDVDEALVDHDLTLSGTTDVYFEGGRFDPDRMLGLLEAFHTNARDAGRAGARVIGEMMPQIKDLPGGERLIEYEERVNKLVATHPVTAVCQYDARAFDGATLMDVLSVHPLMVVRGAVVRNPFYTEPEAFPG